MKVNTVDEDSVRIELDADTGIEVTDAVNKLQTNRAKRMILQCWGFELVLHLEDYGVIRGYINDTAD